MRPREAGTPTFELPYVTARGRAAVTNPGRRQLAEALREAPPGRVEVEFELGVDGQPTEIRPASPRVEAEAVEPEDAAPASEALQEVEGALGVVGVVGVASSHQLPQVVLWREVGAGRGWMVEPPEARAGGWGGQLRRALGGSVPVESVPLSAEEAALPGSVRRRVVEALLRSARGPVAFAWGGDHPAGAGVWEAFIAWWRRDPQGGHVAVRLDLAEERVLVWSSPTTVEARPLRVRPGFAQLVAARGFEENASAAPPPVDPEEVAVTERLFASRPEYRRFCFEWAGRLAAESVPGLSIDAHRLMVEESFQRTVSLEVMGQLVEEGLRNAPASMGEEAGRWVVQGLGPWLRRALGTLLRQQSVEPSPVALPADPAVLHWLTRCNGGALEEATARGSVNLGISGCDRFSLLFERLLEARVRRWAAAREAWLGGLAFNPTIRRPGSGQNLGEFDVALVTRLGRLVVLDAKTFDDDVATRRAQTQVVEQVGGAQARRCVVVPAFAPEVGRPDLSAPLDAWGLAPWYPRKLAVLLARAADPRATAEERLLVLPYDASDALERGLDTLCGVPAWARPLAFPGRLV